MAQLLVAIHMAGIGEAEILRELSNKRSFDQHAGLQGHAVGPAIWRMRAEILFVDRIDLCDVTIKLLQVKACGSDCGLCDADGGQDVIKLAENFPQLGSGSAGHEFRTARGKAAKNRFEYSARMDDGRAKWEIGAGSDEFHSRNVLIDRFQINAIDR